METILIALFGNDFLHNFMPLATLLASLLCLRRRSRGVQISASLLFGMAAFVFFKGIAFLWIFRDGMKVGMVPSHGADAVSRFATHLIDILIVIVVTGVLIALGSFVAWRKPKPPSIA